MSAEHCDDCYRLVSWPLIGACASVGIEHGLTTEQVLVEYLTAYHARGHVINNEAAVTRAVHPTPPTQETP